jgi:hypothetical protein
MMAVITGVPPLLVIDGASSQPEVRDQPGSSGGDSPGLLLPATATDGARSAETTAVPTPTAATAVRDAARDSDKAGLAAETDSNGENQGEKQEGGPLGKEEGLLNSAHTFSSFSSS